MKQTPAQLRAKARTLLLKAERLESAPVTRSVIDWPSHPVGLVPDEWLARIIDCAPNAVRTRRLREGIPVVPATGIPGCCGRGWNMDHRNAWVAWRSEWGDRRVRDWLRAHAPTLIDMHRKVMESGPPRYATAAHSFGVSR